MAEPKGPDDDISALGRALLAPYHAAPEMIPIPAFQYATPEDYAACLKPRAALEQFPYAQNIAITQLHRELEVGRVTGIAEHAVWSDAEGVGQSYYLIMQGWFWNRDIEPSDDFWDTGYLLRFFPVKGYNVAADRWIKVFDVRFYFPALATTVEPPAPPATDKPTVSRDDLGRWYEVFAAVHPNAVEALALRSATAMFPDNHIPRQWVRDLRGAQPRGKPKARHD